MSVFFVYRSHYDNPSAFHVKVFPQDTVLEWFRSVCREIRGFSRFGSIRYTTELIGRPVEGLSDLFSGIHANDWPLPNTMSALARWLRDALPADFRYGEHHVQFFTDDDEREHAAYIFDDHYAVANPHRAAFLMHEDWNLPDGASEAEFKPKGVRGTAKLVRGVGATYFAHFAANDGDSLSELGSLQLAGKVSGVRVADFPRYLFALQNRVAENPDDETLSGNLRELLSGLSDVTKAAKGDEKAFLAALTANPNDYAGWCAYSDWRMERDLPPLLSDVLRLYDAEVGAAVTASRNPRKDHVVAQTHVAQASKHVAKWGNTALFHHFILFDDLWANANRDLAASILRTASRWNPL